MLLIRSHIYCSSLLIISSITLAINTEEIISSSIEENIESIFNEKVVSENNNWDVLIFTQQWPVTACIHWESENPNNACDLPSEKEFWTIHGIWPTKLGTIGPSFCNKTSKFDINTLNIIVDNLKIYWPNIEDGMSFDSLWRHEWDKHGTCAISNERLNNEMKYFNQGLNWRTKYLISDILDKSSIYPDTNHSVINIQNALKKTLNKNPSIHCLYDHHKDISYLSEIRICFNKSLDLIDCDGVSGANIAIDYPGGKLITNCHISKPVSYPSIVPPKLKINKKWNVNFIEIYKLLNFIMWLTL